MIRSELVRGGKYQAHFSRSHFARCLIVTYVGIAKRGRVIVRTADGRQHHARLSALSPLTPSRALTDTKPEIEAER